MVGLVKDHLAEYVEAKNKLIEDPIMEDYNKLTKKQILARLEKHDIKATLRPRKAVLIALLELVEKEHKEGTLTSDVLMFDDIYYKTLDPRKKDNVWAWPYMVFYGFCFLVIIGLGIGAARLFG